MADRKDDREDRVVAQAPVAGYDNTKQVAEATKKQEAEEKKRIEADQQKLEEGRKLVHERERMALEEAQKNEDARIDAERKAREDKAKEDERLSKLTPEQREAEISPFVHSVPHFTPQNEPIHPAEFILSEANGQRSRGNAYIADPATILAGQMLKKTAEATASQFATYVPAAVGADCHAIAIYSGGTIPGEGLRISVIVRDAEVNGKCLVWGAVTAPEQIIAAQTLAAAGIIIRT